MPDIIAALSDRRRVSTIVVALECRVISHLNAYGHLFAHGCAFNRGKQITHIFAVSFWQSCTDRKENQLPQRLLLLLCPILLRKMLGCCLMHLLLLRLFPLRMMSSEGDYEGF